jgi:hypothetical protein
MRMRMERRICIFSKIFTKSHLDVYVVVTSFDKEEEEEEEIENQNILTLNPY